MSFLSNLQQKSPQTRWIIAIIIIILVMSAVVYIWYNSLQSTLSGSFEIAKSKQEAVQTQGGVQESFLTSLKNLLSDLNLDVSRFKEIGASLMQIRSFIPQQLKESPN